MSRPRGTPRHVCSIFIRFRSPELASLPNSFLRPSDHTGHPHDLVEVGGFPIHHAVGSTRRSGRWTRTCPRLGFSCTASSGLTAGLRLTNSLTISLTVCPLACQLRSCMGVETRRDDGRPEPDGQTLADHRRGSGVSQCAGAVGVGGCSPAEGAVHPDWQARPVSPGTSRGACDCR
jgi:hypothetical protein